MSQFVGEFDVTSRLTDRTYHCRFSHLWNGIATRHSDTVDTKFLVDGQGSIVGLAHPGIVQFTAKRATSPPSICESSSSRKTSGRSTMSPRRMLCALLDCSESAERDS
jgi:hypothetical protein